MGVVLDTVDISSGKATTIDFSARGIPNPPEVKLQNESAFACTVNIGSDSHWLGAWMADVFPLYCRSSFKVVPTQLQSPAPANVPSATLLIEVAREGESIPGTYPATLARMTNISAANVTIQGTPSVSISGTPTVNIASGTVTISGTAQINIASQSATMTIGGGQKNLGVAATLAGGGQADTSLAIPADVQSLILVPEGGANNLFTRVAVIGNVTNITYFDQRAGFPAAVITVPIGLVPILSSKDTSVTIRISASATMNLRVYGLTASYPEWMQWYPLPQQAPNQTPLFAGAAALANNTATWLISPVAGVKINLFSITTTWIAPASGSVQKYFVGHDTVLPVASPAAGQTLFKSGNSGSFSYPFLGNPLLAGEGIYLWNESGVALEAWHLLNYSLS